MLRQEKPCLELPAGRSSSFMSSNRQSSSSNVSVRVASVEVSKEPSSRGSSYTFVLELRRDSVLTRSSHRYSSLRQLALHLTILEPQAAAALPPFPSRQPLRKQTSTFLVERGIALEHYIGTLLASPVLAAYGPVRSEFHFFFSAEAKRVDNAAVGLARRALDFTSPTLEALSPEIAPSLAVCPFGIEWPSQLQSSAESVLEDDEVDNAESPATSVCAVAPSESTNAALPQPRPSVEGSRGEPSPSSSSAPRDGGALPSGVLINAGASRRISRLPLQQAGSRVEVSGSLLSGIALALSSTGTATPWQRLVGVLGSGEHPWWKQPTTHTLVVGLFVGALRSHALIVLCCCAFGFVSQVYGLQVVAEGTAATNGRLCGEDGSQLHPAGEGSHGSLDHLTKPAGHAESTSANATPAAVAVPHITPEVIRDDSDEVRTPATGAEIDEATEVAVATAAQKDEKAAAGGTAARFALATVAARQLPTSLPSEKQLQLYALYKQVCVCVRGRRGRVESKRVTGCEKVESRRFAGGRVESGSVISKGYSVRGWCVRGSVRGSVRGCKRQACELAVDREGEQGGEWGVTGWRARASHLTRPPTTTQPTHHSHPCRRVGSLLPRSRRRACKWWLAPSGVLGMWCVLCRARRRWCSTVHW